MTFFISLSVLVWLPVFGGLIAMVFYNDPRYPLRAKFFSLLVALLSLLVSLYVLHYFDIHSSDMQAVENRSWLDYIGARYHLGVDGLSLPLILLNQLMTCVVMVSSWDSIDKRVGHYYGLFLVMAGLVNGAFLALDGLLFYFFFEASLVPFYLIIGIWGGRERVYAAFKFFLYTLFGSVFFLLSIIYLRFVAGSFEILDWHIVPLQFLEQAAIFFAFLLSFGIKTPMWPVHTWLPDAHVQAPTGGSIILAAIALKLGGYGFFRFILPIVPDACRYFAPFVIGMSLVAIVYIALIALVQQDMKKLVAYSSVSHMGFVTLGCFMLTSMGLEGALFQMISHGFVSAAMFFCIGILYDRAHTRNIQDYGGVVNRMPIFSLFALIFFMANCGLPATSGFVGELMVILAAIKHHLIVGLLAALSLIIGAAYTLWMYKRIYWGEANALVETLTDVNKKELGVLIVLSVCVIVAGVYPKPIGDLMHVSIDHLVQQAFISKM